MTMGWSSRNNITLYYVMPRNMVEPICSMAISIHPQLRTCFKATWQGVNCMMILETMCFFIFCLLNSVVQIISRPCRRAITMINFKRLSRSWGLSIKSLEFVYNSITCYEMKDATMTGSRKKSSNPRHFHWLCFFSSFRNDYREDEAAAAGAGLPQPQSSDDSECVAGWVFAKRWTSEFRPW